MKISELPYAGSITDSDYVLAVQNGQTVKATATAFKGDKGDTGQGVLAVSQTAVTIAPEGIYPLDCLSVINVFAPVNTTPEKLHPSMTGFTTPSGVVTASPDSSLQGWKVFDDDNNTAYAPNTKYCNITYQFPHKVIVNSYVINTQTTYAYAPRDWALLGSNDGTSWAILDSYTASDSLFADRVDKTFNFTNVTSYLYYRLSIYNTALWYNGTINLYKLHLFGYAGYRALTNGVDYEVLKGDPSDRQITGIKNLMATETQFLIDYVNDQQLDNNGILFINGSDGADGADGVGVPPGGIVGQALLKSSTSDYGTAWGSSPYGVVDLTSASSDYALAVGETAIVTYTSETSVPLHVETSEGVYEIIAVGDITTNTTTTGDVYLKPNNGTVTGIAASATQICLNTAAPNNFILNKTYFVFGNSLMLGITAKIFTHTKQKYYVGEFNYKYHSNGYFYRDLYAGNWSDSTTAWTSLGTVVFPFVQSGKIIIRRIA